MSAFGATSGLLIVAVGVSSPGQLDPIPRADGTDPNAECRYGSWSSLKRTAELPTGFQLSLLSAVDLSSTAGVVGILVPIRKNSSPGNWVVPLDPLLITVEDGAKVRRPPGNFRFINPRIGADPKGTLHLVWGEPEPNGAEFFSDYLNARITSLWHSEYSGASGWGSPVEVYRTGAADRPTSELAIRAPGGIAMRTEDGPAAEWNYGPPFQFDVNGNLHFVVAPMGGGAIVHLSQRGNGWIAEMIPRARGRYAELAAGNDSHLSVVFLGYPGTAVRERSPLDEELLFVSSEDVGRTWSEPRTVATMEEGNAVTPRVFVAPSGLTHVLWGQNLAGGWMPQVIRHTYSRDNGQTWPELTSFPLPGPFTDWDAVLDPCGTLHLVFVNAGSMRYTRWQQGWEEMVLVYDGPRQFFRPDVSVARDGTAIRIFGTTLEAEIGDSIPVFSVAGTSLEIRRFP